MTTTMAAESQQPKHTISVILWGGDKPGEDPPAHIALAVHESVSQPKICHLHHARCPDQVQFIYESRPEQLFDADPAPRGRCNLRANLSTEEAQSANKILERFGADGTELHYFGEGNCHNWAAGAVGVLEKAGLAMQGDGLVWTAMIGLGPSAMEAWWKDIAMREWVACGAFNRKRPDVVDAKWDEEVVVGKVGSDGVVSNFKDRVGRLQQLLGGG
ncbi:hypothetical protein F5Y16DRAFT_154491 [Xylariaceae sp. FL0255]|nr:hypothetical protein F5Y16DRAFT_154491 [Xylariaceae sp. FL0255]